MLTAIKRVLGVSNEDMIGSVSAFAGSYSPRNTLPCEGQLLPIGNNQYTKLFSISGTIYGGDGIKTFALPDLRPTDKKGLKISWAEAEVPRQVICVEGIYPQRP